MSTVYETGTVVQGPEATETAAAAPAAAALESAVVARAVSGLYLHSRSAAIAEPAVATLVDEAPEASNGHGRLELADEALQLAAPSTVGVRPIREELRLDVDGRYPQRIVSGTIRSLLNRRLHWIARLAPVGPNAWSGPILFKEGTLSLLPQTKVRVVVVGSAPTRTAKVTFSGPGGTVSRLYKFSRSTFRDVEFEFDCEQGQVATTQIHTHGHPNHPAGLPGENLSLETVYTRAGFRVTKSGGDTFVPTIGAGADTVWTD
jgi:hypothetical protein